MLNNITWQQFVIAITLIALTYYLFVIVFFFRDVLFRILNGKAKPVQQTGEPELDESDDLRTRFQNRLGEQDDSIVASESGNENDLLIGTVADLLEEIKALAHVIVTNESSKEEAESFYRLLLSRYDQLVNTPYQQSINTTILKLFNEDISMNTTLSEIQSWWPNSISRNN